MLWFLPAFRAGGGVPTFYQEQFGPGVMLACGRGFANVDEGSVPALRAFLERRTTRLLCSDLESFLPRTPLKPFQRWHMYLIRAVGLIWRFTSISWDSIDVLSALLFAVTLAAAYVALRFICGRALSLFVVVLWWMSPLHLAMAPHLRDYSKAPFFVLMLVALGVLVYERRASRLIPLGLVFGAVQGIGFGMRTDVILNVLPFLFVLFAATPGGLRRNIPAKLGSAAATIVMFMVVTVPVFKGYQAENNMWHIALLGLLSPFDQGLDMKPAPYDFGHAYLDGYVEATVGSYWGRAHPDAPTPTLPGALYTVATREYYLGLARMFPGDLIARVLASSLRVLSLPSGMGPIRLGIPQPAFSWAVKTRVAFAGWFANAGLLAALAVLILFGIEDIRYACVAGLLLFGWSAYPFLEFEGRHVFPLELIGLGLLAAVVPLTWRRVCEIRQGRPARDLLIRAARAASVVAVALLLLAVSLAGARVVQVRQVRQLLSGYLAAPATRLETSGTTIDADRVHLALDVFRGPRAEVKYGADSAMVAVRFNGDRCGRSPLQVGLWYDDRAPAMGLNFSRRVDVPLAQGPAPTVLFVPVYALYRQGRVVSRFAAIDVPVLPPGCVEVYRVDNPKSFGSLPLLNATLIPGWESRPLYQRINLMAAMPAPFWRPIVHWWRGVTELG